jgi:hypothetical protein
VKPAAALVALLLAAPTDGINFTANSVNVAEPGRPVKISVSRWSTDDERAPIVAALSPRPAPPVGPARNPE